MPIFTYECKKCGMAVERIVNRSDRDTPSPHDDCGGMLAWAGLDCPTVGKPGYQMKAILGNGAHIDGHFGKEAARRRKKRK